MSGCLKQDKVSGKRVWVCFVFFISSGFWTFLHSHLCSILTPDQPVPALTLSCQVPGRVATGVPILKSLVSLDPQKSRRKWDLNPGYSALALEAYTLTTGPTRRSGQGVERSHKPWVSSSPSAAFPSKCLGFTFF